MPEIGDNPYTGNLVIAINDSLLTAIEADTEAVREFWTLLGNEEFQQLDFSFEVESHPGLYIKGPPAILRRIMDYCWEQYPRLGPEWEQI